MVHLKTSLAGNFRLVVMEERFEQRTGVRYLVDEQGNIWKSTGENLKDEKTPEQK